MWFSFKHSCVSVEKDTRTYPNDKDPRPGTLLFLHGRLEHSGMWEGLVRGLSNDYRCFSLDLPGYGRSFSVGQEALSLLEHASLVSAFLANRMSVDQKVVLIGHDVGGGIAQLVALRYPEQVEGLVLINSACLTESLGRLSPDLRNWTLKSRIARLLKKSPALSSEDRELLLQPWGNKFHRRNFSESFRAFENSWPWFYEQKTWKEAMKYFLKPVLLLWGKHDEMNPPEIGMTLAKRYPEAEFFSHDEAGHWPFLEHKDWVLSKMRHFLFHLNLLSAELQTLTPYRKSLLL